MTVAKPPDGAISVPEVTAVTLDFDHAPWVGSSDHRNLLVLTFAKTDETALIATDTVGTAVTEPAESVPTFPVIPNDTTAELVTEPIELDAELPVIPIDTVGTAVIEPTESTEALPVRAIVLTIEVNASTVSVELFPLRATDTVGTAATDPEDPVAAVPDNALVKACAETVDPVIPVDAFPDIANATT
jgi:hypothetical protein